MKNFFTAVLVLAVSFASFQAGQARAEGVVDAQQIPFVELALLGVQPTNLIDWKVGDNMNYSVSMMGMDMGTSVKSVTSDEGTAIWVKQDMKLMGQNQLIEILMNKADGKILKMKQNGQDAQIPDDKIEIISQDSQDITVKAGHFQSIHVVAKTEKISKVEVWVNPRDTAMDGTLKQAATTQMGVMTLELTGFKRN